MLTSPSARKLARLNRRQRKKHHVAEFRELGFTLTVRFESPQQEADLDNFWDGLFLEAERLNLIVGGLGGRLPLSETGAFVVATNGSVQAEQRESLLAWLSTWPTVANASASEMIDAWYFADQAK